MELPEKLMAVVKQFSKLPGVGEKTALRQSLVLSYWDANQLMEFGESLKELSSLKKCELCGMFSDGNLCNVCQSFERSTSKIICVVEGVTDCLAIERGGQFKGKYHILGGVLNPLMGIGPDQLGIDKLLLRVHKEEITEIILAVNPSVEGDATCSYINQMLLDERNESDVISVQRIGMGIPIGGSLEYLDAMTINKALENKKRM